MLYNQEVAVQTAELLLKVKAVKLSPKELFTWASGIQSPIYCDNRVTLSYPEIRTYIRQNFSRIVRDHFDGTEVIAGVATGGIAQGALVAQELGLPMVYVRSEKKEHGLTNQIEGVVQEGQRVVVVEDLVSTGGSSLKAVTALREAGCRVLGMVAIFTYNLPISVQKFQEASCELIALSDYDTLIEQALAIQYITPEDQHVLRKFKQQLSNP